MSPTPATQADRLLAFAVEHIEAARAFWAAMIADPAYPGRGRDWRKTAALGRLRIVRAHCLRAATLYAVQTGGAS